MDAIQASDRFQAHPFEPLMDGALDFLPLSLEITAGRAVPVAESFPVLLTAEDKDCLVALQAIAAVID